MSSTKRRGRGQRSSWSLSRAGSRGRTRDKRLGAAGKFALAEKSLHFGEISTQPTRAGGFLVKTVLCPLYRVVCLHASAWTLQVPVCHSPPSPGRRAWALRTISAVRAEILSELTLLTIQPFGQLPTSGTSTALNCAQVWPWLAASPTPSPGTHSPDMGKWRTGVQKTGNGEGPNIRGTDTRLGSGAEGAASYQEMQFPLLR